MTRNPKAWQSVRMIISRSGHGSCPSHREASGTSAWDTLAYLERPHDLVTLMQVGNNAAENAIQKIPGEARTRILTVELCDTTRSLLQLKTGPPSSCSEFNILP